MDKYNHHVSGFFVHRDEAQIALSKLVERGLPRERLQIFENNAVAPTAAPDANSNAVLKDLVVDGAIGTAVGTGVGVLAELALVAANVTLFVASPLIAPLAMLGWGASLGGVIGAVAGAVSQKKETKGWFAEMVSDAIQAGQVVLVVETLTEQETAVAREVMQESVGEYKDINTA